jgi:hypothetical protein
MERAKQPLVDQVVQIATRKKMRIPISCTGSDWGGEIYKDTLGGSGYWGGTRSIMSWSEEELRSWLDRHGKATP